MENVWGGGVLFIFKLATLGRRAFLIRSLQKTKDFLFFCFNFFSISSEGCGFARPRNQFDLFHITSLFPSCLDFRIGAGQKRPSIFFFFLLLFPCSPPPSVFPFRLETHSSALLYRYSLSPRLAVRPSAPLTHQETCVGFSFHPAHYTPPPPSIL